MDGHWLSVLCVERPFATLTWDYIMTIVSQTPMITTMCVVIFWATTYIHTIIFKKNLDQNIRDITVVAHCTSPTVYSISPTWIPLAPSSEIYKISFKKIVNKHLLPF